MLKVVWFLLKYITIARIKLWRQAVRLEYDETSTYRFFFLLAFSNTSTDYIRLFDSEHKMNVLVL